MSVDHRDCDEALTRFEDAVRDGGVEAFRKAFQAFREAMLRHFAREEDALFPAFEAATGNTQGPTAVMRMEHQQMRMVLEQLADDVARDDRAACLGRTDTLMLLAQQHNMKEEQILYPMCDQVCADAAALLERLRAPDAD